MLFCCADDCFRAERNIRPLTLDGTIYSGVNVTTCRKLCLSDGMCEAFAFSPRQSFCMIMSENVAEGDREYNEDFEFWVKTTCEGWYYTGFKSILLPSGQKFDKCQFECGLINHH